MSKFLKAGVKLLTSIGASFFKFRILNSFTISSLVVRASYSALLLVIINSKCRVHSTMLPFGPVHEKLSQLFYYPIYPYFCTFQDG